MIQLVLEPLSHVVEKVPRYIRNVVFSLCILTIVLLEFARYSGLYSGRFLYQYAVVYLVFGVMILAVLVPGLKPVHFSLPITVCWLVISVFMVLTGIFVEIDALAEAIVWIAILPVFYLVLSGSGFDRAVSPIICGILLSFLVFSVISIFFFPITKINYASFFLNRNRTGVYCATVFTCLTGYLFATHKCSLRTLLADVLLGFTAATIYYTNCRAAIFATGLSFILSCLLQLYIYRKTWQTVLLHQVLPAVAAIILLMPTAIYIYQGGYQLKASIQAATSAPEPPSPSEEVIPPETVSPATPPSTVLDEMKDYNERRFTTTEPNLNYYTSGRVALWRIHLREVGLLGNSSEKVLYKEQSNEVESRSSHFTIIQYAYSFGAPAGIAFLILNILAGLASIRYAIERRELIYALWPFTIAIAYGGESVMEALISPVISSLTLLYFLSLAPLVIHFPAVPKSALKH